MSHLSPPETNRRAAARRKQVIESDDDEDEAHHSHDGDDDNDSFTPAPAQRSRRPARRKAIQEESETTMSGRDHAEAEEQENENIFSPPASVGPVKKRAPTARKSVRAGRKSLLQISESDSTTNLPTSQPSISPAPADVPPTPLSDITKPTLNASVPPIPNTSTMQLEKPTIPSQPAEKPMDIVVRTRAKAMPQMQEQHGPRPRMVITYLVLTNFKSYAGRQVVGPFHSSFSSVVGPNGSGKSNVIDSLLFVFGFRASKMRQGKISALIHNSAGFLDLDFCEVEVHFQQVIDHPSGTKEVVPDSNLVVSRKAFKSNASKYYINGSDSSFTTVTTLLRNHGIDLDHKRFLILQGEVESIAQMKPKAANEHDDGLLEYLEDIIGTSKYKAPIEESATETETLNEVCREKNTRVQHVEKEKTGLEAKKKAALAYIKHENDLSLKQSALWQIFIHECDDNNAVTNEAIGQLQAQLEQETTSHRGREDEIAKLGKEHSAELKEFERIQKSNKSLLDQLAKADKEAVKFDEKKKHLQGRMKKLEKSASTSQAALSEAVAYLTRLEEDLERNRSSIIDLERDLQQEEAALSNIRDNLKGKTQAFSDQIGAKQKMQEPWQEQINQQNSAISVARSEVDMLRARENAGAQALWEVQSRLQSLHDEKGTKANHLQELEGETKACSTQSKETEKALQKLTLQEPDTKSRVSVARQKVDEAKASLSHSQNQGSVLSGLMRLKDSGRITGFHGRLGNLGTIDQNYDVAISTACPALDNLVVDTVEVGQQCIEFLRKNNLGRANFILLDRLSQKDLSPISTPEGADRLFDLVKPKDSKFLPAFYSILQNTLVAADLEQASRLAYGAKRWRVVTLDGQLIDKSGTMSGGGTRVAKGAMSAKIVSETSKEQVTKLEQTHEAEERNLQVIRDQQQNLEASRTTSNDRMANLETQMQKTRLEIESIDRNVSDMEKRVAELTSSKQPTQSDGGHIQELEDAIGKHESEIQKLSKNTIGLENEIKELQEKIMEVGGVKMRGQKAKVDGIKEQISTLNEEISNAEVSQAKTEKARVKHVKAKDDASAETITVESETQQLTTDMKDQSQGLSASKKDAEEAREALLTKKEKLAALKADLDQQTSELNETRGAEIEMRNQLEENQKVLSENNKRLKYWQEKLGKLTVQNVGDLDTMTEEQSLATYSRDELKDLDKNVLKGEIVVLEEKTQNSNVELGVLSEYRRRCEEHASRSSDLAEAVGLRDTAKRRCEDMRRIRLEGFMEGFSTISLRLKEMYQMITMGGNAELELVDSLDPFSEGILFSVMPPKKSWKNISNLSGGEKTLSSLALVFALHHYKPTPLYVMDEIDAALDFRNVSIVASYIKERTKNAQFIVISLRNNMFELASRLVGIYKVNHMTKSVTVENRDYIDRTRTAIAAS